MTADPLAQHRGRHLWLIGLGCLALTVAFYHPAFQLAFVGDDVWFVRPNPHWLRDALTPSSTNFHYFPVYQILLAALPALTGWHPEVMHALNFLLYAGVGLALCLWLRQLGVGWRACIVACVFLMSRGINYEVVTWITELGYILVVVLTILSCAWWDRYLSGRGAKYLVWTLAGFAVAVFTIEHAMLLLPLYAAFEWIMHPGATRRPGQPAASGNGPYRWRRLGGRLVRMSLRYVPFVLVVLAFFAVKLGFHGGLLSSHVAQPTASAKPLPSGERLMAELPRDRMWLGILNTPRRAYGDLLLSTSYLFLPIGACHGADDTLLTRHAWLVLVPWLALHLWIVWKGQPIARFLLAWMYLYLLPLAMASVPQARYYFLATIPAAGLVGLGVSGLHDRLSRRVPRLALDALAVLLLTALVYGEGVFVRARLREWTLASDLVRQTTSRLQQDLGRGVREVYLLNFPRGVPGPFWNGYAFGVSAELLQLMLHPPRTDVVVHPVYDRSFVAGSWPTVGTYTSAEELRGRLQQADVIAYEFLGSPPWIARLR